MSDLKTDYRDDVLDVSANVKRIFNLVDQDGKIVVANVSIQDITKYTQEGDSFGAADINATNEAVNGKLDGSSTVDPKLATEEGFAADAKLTGDALSELNSNLESCFQSVSDGKASVASAITGKGVNTASDATFATMAANINKIKKAATADSGYFEVYVGSSNTVGSYTVTFSTPFSTAPTINFSVIFNSSGSDWQSTGTISNVTAAGFTFKTTGTNSNYGTYKVTWNATG